MNKSGTIDFKNLNGVVLNITSKMSVNTLTNCSYAELWLDVSTSSQFTLSKSTIDVITITATSSHVLLDYVT